MQIDIISQNTLKLTLSKLDMFDLDIKYDSLSSKNPETKRLLSHVVKSIQLDKRVDFDFSGERLFIEAFPRVDGGCMLYISCLEDSDKKPKRTRQSTADPVLIAPARKALPQQSLSSEGENTTPMPYSCVCEPESFDSLKAVCRNLLLLKKCKKLQFESSLFQKDKVYRLVITTAQPKAVNLVTSEYGTVFKDKLDLLNTEEYFRLITDSDAVEKLSRC